MDDNREIKRILETGLLSLNVEEVNELAKILKDEYGITIAAAAVVIGVSAGIDLDEKNLYGQIYLDTDDDVKALEIYNNFKLLLKTFDLEIDDEGEIIRGSWFREFRAKVEKFFSKKETQDRLKKIEEALELKHLENPQADIDLKKAEAAERLLKSLNGTKNAAIKIGSLVLIKMTNKDGEESVVVVTLTTEKMRHLDNNPNLLGNPQELLANLNKPE